MQHKDNPTIIRLLPSQDTPYLDFTKIISIFANNMSRIIDYVEKLRVQQRAKKRDLCKFAGISQNSYTNYLNGSKPSYETIEAILTGLDKQILIIDKL